MRNHLRDLLNAPFDLLDNEFHPFFHRHLRNDTGVLTPFNARGHGGLGGSCCSREVRCSHPDAPPIGPPDVYLSASREADVGCKGWPCISSAFDLIGPRVIWTQFSVGPCLVFLEQRIALPELALLKKHEPKRDRINA